MYIPIFHDKGFNFAISQVNFKDDLIRILFSFL